MRIEIPERDTPRWPTVAAVGAVCLGSGLAIAAWGMNPPPEARAGFDGEEARIGAAPQDPEVGPEPAPAPATAPATAPEPEPEPEPETAAPGTLRVRRGRVAYLRCDAGTGHACPRDEELEAAIWPILDGLLDCANPPVAAGRADLRLEYRAEGAPDVEWRDTFSEDVVRLDRARVMGCLREPLATTRQTAGAGWLLLSFRFRAE